MPDLDPNLGPLARGMLNEGIIKFGGPFTLKDGSQSTFYINLREMIAVPDLFVPAVDAYADTLVEAGMLNRADGTRRHIAGIPEAAFYYAGAVGYRLRAPLMQRRVSSKGHGIQQNVMGRPGPDTELVLLDDVIKSSLSKTEEAARMDQLTDGSVSTTGVVVLVDRQQGGRTEIESHGIDFAAAMTIDGIARYALENRIGGMTPALYDDLRAELDPAELARA